MRTLRGAGAEQRSTTLLAAAPAPAAGAVRDAADAAACTAGAGCPGYVRRSSGPGWALVGDAGYFKDPITTHGITDALRDAELLADAVLEVLGGAARCRARRLPGHARPAVDARCSTSPTVAPLRLGRRAGPRAAAAVSSAMSDEVDYLTAAGVRRPPDVITQVARARDRWPGRPIRMTSATRGRDWSGLT